MKNTKDLRDNDYIVNNPETIEILNNPPKPKEDLKNLLSVDVGDLSKEEVAAHLKRIKTLFDQQPLIPVTSKCTVVEFFPTMYQMISSEEELKWFYDHIIQKPAVNESYSAVFVCRHKKLTDEEKKTLGLTRKESEFLATQTFRRKTFKDALYQDEENNWLFERFLSTLKRFNVDKGAYTTALGEPLPEKTLAVIFYVNPCDDIKVMREFVDEYMNVNQAISKAMLGGKTTIDNLQSYQWFGRAETNLKHLKANCKGTKYWMDLDIDVPSWFKEKRHYTKHIGIVSIYRLNEGDKPNFTDEHGRQYIYQINNEDIDFRATHLIEGIANIDKDYELDISYYELLKEKLNERFGKGNYVIVDTSGGYHVLVKTSAIKSNPHDLCNEVQSIYFKGIYEGEEPYLDEKGNCKFECIVNDSQIPGIPLPGTYQYGRPVTVLNKEDFE
jgi:hypothetical protein